MRHRTPRATRARPGDSSGSLRFALAVASHSNVRQLVPTIHTPHSHTNTHKKVHTHTHTTTQTCTELFSALRELFRELPFGDCGARDRAERSVFGSAFEANRGRFDFGVGGRPSPLAANGFGGGAELFDGVGGSLCSSPPSNIFIPSGEPFPTPPLALTRFTSSLRSGRSFDGVGAPRGEITGEIAPAGA